MADPSTGDQFNHMFGYSSNAPSSETVQNRTRVCIQIFRSDWPQEPPHEDLHKVTGRSVYGFWSSIPTE
jgi:hypothetical protein